MANYVFLDDASPAVPANGNFVMLPGEPVSNPADEMSTLQRGLAGAGSRVADMIHGAKTMAATSMSRGVPIMGPTGQVNLGGDSIREQGQKWLAELQQQAAEKRAIDKPLLDTTAGTVGKVGADIAMLLPTAATGAVGAFASNAALGAFEPTTAEDSVAWNALKGGAMGLGGKLVADAFGSILRGVKPTDEQIIAAKQFADKWGGVLSRGQMTGSELMQRIERISTSVGSKFGPRASEANSGAMKRAFDSVTGGDAGDLYKGLSNYGFTVDKQLANVAKEAEGAFPLALERPQAALDRLNELFVGKGGTPNPALAAFGPQARAAAIKQGVPDTVGGVAPQLPVGKTIPLVGERGVFDNAQSLRSEAAALARRNTPESSVYAQLTDALDAAAERNLVRQGADAGTMKSIRDAYSLEKAVRKAATVDEHGAVTGYDPVKISNIVKQMEASQPGRLDRMGEVGKLLREAAAFGRVAKPASSSGTSENAIAGKVAGLEMVKDAVGAMMHGGNVFNALLQSASPIAGAVFGPRLVNAIMQSSRNGILPEATSVVGRKAADAAALLGQSASRALPFSLSLGDLLPGANSGQ